jgi:hypothetical protein
MPVVLPGWFDDSERDDGKRAVSALGGCVGTKAQWEIQDSAWIKDVLEPFGLTEEGYHAKKFASFRGPYEQFSDPLRARELSDAILGTFKKSQVRPFAAMTRLSDLRRFNQERGRQVRHYALNIYTCMSYIRRSFRRELIGDSFVQMKSGQEQQRHRYSAGNSPCKSVRKQPPGISRPHYQCSRSIDERGNGALHASTTGCRFCCGRGPAICRTVAWILGSTARWRDHARLAKRTDQMERGDRKKGFTI